jgi:hypothetical protein
MVQDQMRIIHSPTLWKHVVEREEVHKIKIKFCLFLN